MWTKLHAASLAILHILLVAQPARAEWKELLVRTFGPPLMNRAINYLSNKKRRYQTPSQNQNNYQPDYSYSAPEPQAWKPQPTWRPKTKTASPKRSAPPNKVPAKPVITQEDMGLVPPSPSKGNASSGKFAIPPPPKMMVPPPPPGVPTGAILGLYPEDLNKLQAAQKAPPRSVPPAGSSSVPTQISQNSPEMPKLAPDYRRASKTKPAK